MVRRIVFFMAACTLTALTIGCSPHLRYTSTDDSGDLAVTGSDEASSAQPHRGRKKSTDDPGYANGCDPHLLQIAESYIGVPYRRGGMSRNGMDCSGFVVTVYSQYADTVLPRSTSGLRHVGRKTGRHNARCGDLVFFRTRAFRGVNHVGIMLGTKKFVHASLSGGVRYNTLDEDYYRTHFAFIKRISL
jgi:cell wall-associated NlpC family hydrolase